MENTGSAISLIAVTAADVEIIGVDLPLRDAEARWGISRNTLKTRAAALGVNLIRVSSTDSRWPAAYIDLGDQLQQHLQAGGTLKDFPGAKPGIASNGATTASSSKAIAKAGDVETLAAVVAAVLAQTTSCLPSPSADPLARAKGLADAADAGLVLTTDELVALGVKGIDGFADGDLAYGYSFHKHNQRNRVLWTVERVIAKPSSAGNLTPLPPTRPVGFGGAIEASYRTVSTHVELPMIY